MKKIRNILVMLIGVFAISGCGLKNEINMNISSDGRMVISELTVVDADLVQSVMNNNNGTVADPNATPATVESVKDYFFNSVANDANVKANSTTAGFTAEQYTDETHVGYKKSITINSIDAVSDSVDVSYNLNDLTDTQGSIETTKLLKKDGNNYVAKFVYDPSKVINANEVIGGETTTTPDATTEGTVTDNTTYLNQITTKEYKYVVTLPVEAVTHNATTVSDDKLTYTWDLSSTDVTNIEFTFSLAAQAPTTTPTTDDATGLSDDMMMYIGIGAIALVAVVVIVVAVSSKKKKAKKVEESVNETVDQTVNTTVEQALESVPSPVDANNTVIEGQPSFEPIEVGNTVNETATTPVEEATPVVETQTEVVEAPVQEEVVAPVEPTVETPVVPVEVAVEMPVEPNAPVEEVAPVMDATPVMEMPAEIDAPAVVEPVVDNTPIMEMPEEPVVEEMPTPVMPAEEQPVEEVVVPVEAPVEVTPVVEETPVTPAETIETVTIDIPVTPAEEVVAPTEEVVEATPVASEPVIETVEVPTEPVVETPAVTEEQSVEASPVMDATPVFETPVAQTTENN